MLKRIKGKESAREFKARSTGGKLNYKTGQITYNKPAAKKSFVGTPSSKSIDTTDTDAAKPAGPTRTSSKPFGSEGITYSSSRGTVNNSEDNRSDDEKARDAGKRFASSTLRGAETISKTVDKVAAMPINGIINNYKKVKKGYGQVGSFIGGALGIGEKSVDKLK